MPADGSSDNLLVLLWQAREGRESRDICGSCVHGATGSTIMHMAETSLAKQLPIFRTTVMKAMGLSKLSWSFGVIALLNVQFSSEAIKEVIFEFGPLLESWQDAGRINLIRSRSCPCAGRLDRQLITLTDFLLEASGRGGLSGMHEEAPAPFRVSARSQE